MALTDPESFGQVVENNIMLERDAETYDQAFQMIFKRFDAWKNEEKDDQEFSQYVDNLKQNIEDKRDEVETNAAINASSEETPIRKPRVFKLDEFKAESPEEAIFVNIQTKLQHWFDSADEGILKATIKSVQKFMHEHRGELSTAFQPALVEEQKKDETPGVITNGSAEFGSETSKATGGAPQPETMPQANVEENVTVVVASVKESPKNSSTYTHGEKKDFIWYKDNHSKPVSEVPREQGVKASGVTEFKPTSAKMEVDNPVPREMGVEKSEIDDYNVEKGNKVDLAKPVARDEGVQDSPLEYIKMQENKNYRGDIQLMLKAVKESIEI